jgi:hypothetical protein
MLKLLINFIDIKSIFNSISITIKNINQFYETEKKNKNYFCLKEESSFI